MQQRANRILRTGAAMLLVLSLIAGVGVGPSAGATRTTEPSGWYNTDYIFAATRGVNEMNVHPGLKITLVPLTLVADTAFLPFALVMGLFGH